MSNTLTVKRALAQGILSRFTSGFTGRAAFNADLCGGKEFATGTEALAAYAAARAGVESHSQKTFTVAAVSGNTNSFGLSGVVLIAPDGEAFEAATCLHTPGASVVKGATVTLPVVSADEGAGRYGWVSLTGRSFEIPRALPPAPANVLREVFGK